MTRLTYRHLAAATLASLVTIGAIVAVGCSDDATTAPPANVDASSGPDASSDAPAPPLPADSGTVPSEAGVDAGELDPRTIPGLAAWFDPDIFVQYSPSNAVTYWQSRAGSIQAKQLTTGSQPTLKKVGEHSVIEFTASQWLEVPAVDLGTSLDFGGGDFLVELTVGVGASPAALGGVLYKTGDAPAPPYTGLQIYGNIEGSAGTGRASAGLDGDVLLLKATSGNAADGKRHVIGFRRVGGRLSLRFDGVEAAAKANAGANADTSQPLYLGGRPSGVHSVAHALGHVLIYRGAVSDANVARIEAFLTGK